MKNNLHTKLAIASLLLWVASLMLPGFMVGQRSEPMIGGSILLWGIVFGWLTMGWAVYANIFYIYAAIKTLSSKIPSTSLLLMVLFSLTIFLFKGVPRDEGTGVTLPIVGWGWGVVLWYLSQILICLSALNKAKKISAKTVHSCLAIAALALIIIFSFRYSQWKSFNTQERGLFLSQGIAFSKMQPCNVSYNRVDAPLISHGSSIALEIEDNLLKSSPGIYIPKLNNILRGEAVWTWYAWPHYPSMNDIAVLKRGQNIADYVLSASRVEDGAEIKVINTKTHKIIHTQSLRKPKSWPGRGSYFCPYSARGYWSGLQEGYDTAIYNALTPPNEDKPIPILTEDLLEKCNLGDTYISNDKEVHDWDGDALGFRLRQIDKTGFCSKHYAARVTMSGPKNNSWFGAGIWLHDRQTKQPIMLFSSNNSCGLRDYCERKQNIDIYSVHIKNKTQIEVKTSIGNFTSYARNKSYE